MPKRNRKKVHYSRYLTINNEELEINASNKFGVFIPILERMFGQLDASFRIHKRVHVVLFILQHRETSQDNKDISKFSALKIEGQQIVKCLVKFSKFKLCSKFSPNQVFKI